MAETHNALHFASSLADAWVNDNPWISASHHTYASHLAGSNVSASRIPMPHWAGHKPQAHPKYLLPLLIHNLMFAGCMAAAFIPSLPLSLMQETLPTGILPVVLSVKL